MTYLELCQMLARESGTVSGKQPTSVDNQTGRLAKVVYWTASAWTTIQNRRNAWRWMRAEFTGTTSAGAARYTHNSFNLERWAVWLTGPEAISLYKQSEGAGDEGLISELVWNEFRALYVRGTHEHNRPVHYAVSPVGELCLGPTPDDAYVVRGEYRKSPQKLVNNADVPEMPERFHEVIAWYGLMLLAEHDEGQIHIATGMRRYRELMSDLARDQLPQVTISAGGLA